jgi:hypothetical protein
VKNPGIPGPFCERTTNPHITEGVREAIVVGLTQALMR